MSKSTITTPPKQKSFLEDLINLKVLLPYLRGSRYYIYILFLIIPLIAVLQGLRPIIMKYAIDDGIAQSNFNYLLKMAVFFCLLVLAEYSFRIIQSLFSAKAVYKMIAELRNFLIHHILNLPMSYHDKSLSGALVTRATSDFDNLSESLTDSVLTSIIDIAVLIGCIIGMFLLNAYLATIILLVLPIVIWIIMFFSASLKKTMLEARKKLARVNAFNQECLQTQATIKLLGAQEDAAKTSHKMALDYTNTQMKSVYVDAVLFALLDGVASICIGLVLWFSLKQFFDPTQSAITVGIIIAMTQYVQQIFEPLKQLGNKIAMLQGAFTSVDRIFSIISVPTESFNSTSSQSQTQQSFSNSSSIIFDKVNFSYQEDRLILDNISFNITAGQSVALVGATGGGKSTIIKLLSQLYTNYSGQILINNQDIKSISLTELRSKIFLVPQDIHLFSGTVAFNIGLNNPKISLDQIMMAAKNIGADSFISKLPNGYLTDLREQGSNLSVGQKQLIVFARCLAHNPEVLVLDEATASIDPASELIIQNALDRLFKGRTSIVVAHRLSTIEKCDNIMVIDGGRIVESGSLSELLAKQGYYYQLHHSSQSNSKES